MIPNLILVIRINQQINTIMLIIILSMKKPINADYSAFTEKLRPILKFLNLLFTQYKNIFSKGYTENWLREIFIIDSVLKTNLWIHKIKDLNREKILGSFYEKELFLSKL